MSSKGLFKGLALGALIGGVAGLLLAPKSGQETREDLMKMLEELKSKANDTYAQAKLMVMARVEQVKEAGKKIDEKKYLSIVSEVVEELKNDKGVASVALTKLSRQLKRDWREVKDVFAGETESSK